MARIGGFHEFVEVGERLLAASVERAEFDARSGERGHVAGGQDLEREVKRQSARMKKIKRPEIIVPPARSARHGARSVIVGPAGADDFLAMEVFITITWNG